MTKTCHCGTTFDTEVDTRTWCSLACYRQLTKQLNQDALVQVSASKHRSAITRNPPRHYGANTPPRPCSICKTEFRPKQNRRMVCYDCSPPAVPHVFPLNTPYVPPVDQKLKRPKQVELPKQVTPPKWQEENMKVLYQRYLELGTLESVSKEYGVTRERIRQILAKGNKRGYFQYPLPPDDSLQHRSLEEVLDLLAENSFQATAQKLGVDLSCLKHYIEKNQITLEVRQEIRNSRLKIKAKLWYDEQVKRLGYHPTSTQMQHDSTLRPGYARISTAYGSFTDFLKEHSITPNYSQARGFNSWSPETQERWKQNYAKRINKKSVRYQQIIDYVKEHGPVSSAKLYEALGLKAYYAGGRRRYTSATGVYGALNRAIEEGKIIVTGTTRTRLFRYQDEHT